MATSSRKIMGRAVIACLGLLSTTGAIAQNDTQQRTSTPSADAGVERERADRQAPQPVLGPQSATVVPSADAQVAAVAPEGVQNLTKVVYEGSTLPASVLDQAVAKFIGKPLSQENVKAIADALSATYAKSDIAYYAVVVPPQAPAGGQLIVRVVEGQLVSHRLVDPTPSTPERLIAKYVQNLRGGPLRKSRLDRYLSLIRDVPGQSVKARILPLNQNGELELELTITRKQVELELSLDNAGIANIVDGPQVQANVQINGTLREGDSTRFSANVPFAPERYQFYSVTHETPIGANGLSVSASAAHLATLTRNNIAGEATLGSLALLYKLVRSGNRNLTLSGSFDALSSSNNFLDTTFGDFETRVLRLGATLSDGDSKQAFAVSGVASQGLKILGSRPFEGFSDEAFTKFNVTASFAQSIKDDLVFKIATRGQYSDDLLPVTEAFPLGGRGKGLAFLPGVLVADQAVGGSVELSKPIKTGSPFLPRIVLFGFTDGSAGRFLARPEFDLAADNVALASAGGGIRFNILGKLNTTVEFAVPIDSPDRFVERPPVVLFNISAAM
jgi:hemolysin activation/secretion protein